MPELDLFNRPLAAPVLCHRCGLYYEGPILAEDGKTVLIPGHTAGDPRFCKPKGTAYERDGRWRRWRRLLG